MISSFWNGDFYVLPIPILILILITDSVIYSLFSNNLEGVQIRIFLDEEEICLIRNEIKFELKTRIPNTYVSIGFNSFFVDTLWNDNNFSLNPIPNKNLGWCYVMFVGYEFHNRVF